MAHAETVFITLGGLVTDEEARDISARIDARAKEDPSEGVRMASARVCLECLKSPCVFQVTHWQMAEEQGFLVVGVSPEAQRSIDAIEVDGEVFPDDLKDRLFTRVGVAIGKPTSSGSYYLGPWLDFVAEKYAGDDVPEQLFA